MPLNTKNRPINSSAYVPASRAFSQRRHATSCPFLSDFHAKSLLTNESFTSGLAHSSPNFLVQRQISFRTSVWRETADVSMANRGLAQFRTSGGSAVLRNSGRAIVRGTSKATLCSSPGESRSSVRISTDAARWPDDFGKPACDRLPMILQLIAR